MKVKWKLRSELEIVIGNDSDWFVYNELFANKQYDQALTYLFDAHPRNPLILDLGANVGYFSLKAADELIQRGIPDFEIIALEASPANIRYLETRLDQKLLDGKAKAFLGLAGYKPGSHAILQSEQHYGHSAVGDPKDTKGVNAKYLDIEKLIGSSIAKIDFLKCDIEGSEEIFIREYLSMLYKVENAVFEFHSWECDVAKCREMLESAGLRSKGVIKEDHAFGTSVEIFSRRQ